MLAIKNEVKFTKINKKSKRLRNRKLEVNKLTKNTPTKMHSIE